LRDSCIRANELVVSGRASDANLASVKVTLGATTVSAPLAADGAWSTTFPPPAEGSVVVTVEAVDATGHSATATIPFTVDRTAPRIEVSESGRPFTGGAFNRTVVPLVRAIDADDRATVTTTLDGQPFVSGSGIASAGNHTLLIAAHDCAGNAADPLSIAFTIDLTAPLFVSFEPADGSTIGSARATIRGRVDTADLASVLMEGSALAATVDGASFTFTDVALAEGTNRFTIVAIDRAGNRTTRTYSLVVKTIAPTVELID